jgi:hypothetical protein
MSEHHENHEKPSHKTVWERDTLERLAFATLAEQRANRRWRIFFRFAWLALIVALFWTGAHKGGMGGANPSQPHTAVVAIKGEIADGADASAGRATRQSPLAYLFPLCVVGLDRGLVLDGRSKRWHGGR